MGDPEHEDAERRETEEEKENGEDAGVEGAWSPAKGRDKKMFKCKAKECGLPLGKKCI